MSEILIQKKEIPIKREVDVLVAGGGIAGVAASLAAARSGRRTLLCEKEFLLGGLATLGMVVIYLPVDDGKGKQVSFGIADELWRLSAKGINEAALQKGKPPFYPKGWLEGKIPDPENDRHRTNVLFNPFIYALDLEKLLVREGVEILYGTWVADAEAKDGKITHVILENIDGRTAVKVNSAVDATGDAVLAYAAGEETAVYKYGNVRSCWYHYLTANGFQLSELSDPISRPGNVKEGIPAISGLDALENSGFLIQTHEKMLRDLEEKRAADPSLKLMNMPTIPDFRMTRRIVGRGESTVEQTGKFVSDSIGCFGNWRRPDPGHELPFSSLFGNKIKNLLTAGRCLSASDEMWDLTRVIPVCAVSGEAAGVAASMTDDLPSLDVCKLQNELVGRGVKLHLKDC